MQRCHATFSISFARNFFPRSHESIFLFCTDLTILKRCRLFHRRNALLRSLCFCSDLGAVWDGCLSYFLWQARIGRGGEGGGLEGLQSLVCETTNATRGLFIMCRNNIVLFIRIIRLWDKSWKQNPCKRGTHDPRAPSVKSYKNPFMFPI